ncbi:hypothetical protein Y032_0248g71, partial [Ancylostoma ceylanicum]
CIKCDEQIPEKNQIHHYSDEPIVSAAVAPRSFRDRRWVTAIDAHSTIRKTQIRRDGDDSIVSGAIACFSSPRKAHRHRRPLCVVVSRRALIFLFQLVAKKSALGPGILIVSSPHLFLSLLNHHWPKNKSEEYSKKCRSPICGRQVGKITEQLCTRFDTSRG